jgi:dihydroorotase
MVDSHSGYDGPGYVGLAGGRIVASGPVAGNSPSEMFGAHQHLEFPGGVLLPGLVDLHAHPAVEDSKYGMDPDVHILPRGTTTVLSQGDAGANNWPRYRERVIGNARTRVRLALNLAASGESNLGHSLGSVAEADVDACVDAIRSGGPLIWGVAINVSEAVCGRTDPREMLRRALDVAEQTQRPLLVGTRHAEDWELADFLGHLRSGDVVTYCFHGLSDAIVQEGRVLACVWEARDRGVLFDIGHGIGSFDFAIAEAAIQCGFLPDTVSTDQYRRHIGSTPQHDLPLTISKLVAAGMRDVDIWPRVTQRPAEVLGLAGEIGCLRVGSCADIVVLEEGKIASKLLDVNGDSRLGGIWEAALVIRNGEVVCGPIT